MSKRRIRAPLSVVVVAVVAVAGVLASVRPAAAESYPQKRDGWFLGFAVAGGWGELTANGQSSGWEFSGAGSFRVGYDLSPELGLGLESNGWTKSEDTSGGTASTSFNLGALALYYHPPSNGLVLRAGLGYGGAHASFKSGNTTVTETQEGFGFTVGAAYDFRVRRTFSIGPQVDFGWMTLDPFDAQYVNVGISFDWHFIGK